MIKDIIKLLRVPQWVKNFFIFFPLFFSRNITDFSLLLDVVIVFIAFSLIASAVYCLNDILDVTEDRKHPQKKERPLASGLLSKNTALSLMLILLVAAFSILFFANIEIKVVYLSGLYLLMNILYCFYLKKIALIDVFIISTGFVIRLFVGGATGNIEISHWLIIITFLLALFLAFAKRKDDYILFVQSGEKARQNINRYSIEFINIVLSIIIAALIISYILYTLSPEVIERIGSSYLYLTSFFVLLGTLRYLQLTMVDSRSYSPTKIIFRDRFIQTTILAWLLLFAYFLYF